MMGDKVKQDAWKAHVKNDLRRAIDLLEEAEAHDVIKAVLAEKGYLDKVKTPTSIGDQEWLYHGRSAGEVTFPFRVIKRSAPGESVGIARATTKELAIAIAALPELVKAGKALIMTYRNVRARNEGERVIEAGIQLLEEALEKTGEL